MGDSSPLVVDRLAAWQEGIYLHVAFSYPKLTRMASLQPTVGTLGFPRASFIFSRFQGLGRLLSDAQHVYTQTNVTLTFVKLVVRECPLKTLVCNHSPSRVRPRVKRGDLFLFTSYRPVPVLRAFYSKILEKILYNRLINFLNIFNILCNNQYGFRKNHSTAYMLIQL